MSLNPVQKLQLHNQIERVLHVKGNYQGGILEMAIVIDRTYEKETVRQLCADIIAACKKQSEIFRNVRLNMVLWGKDGIFSESTASAYVQTGTYFDAYEKQSTGEEGAERVHGELTHYENYAKQKGYSGMYAEEIMEYLKKFHARSKLILLLTPDPDRCFGIADPDRMRQAMNPFLKQKLIIVSPEKIEAGAELYRRI